MDTEKLKFSVQTWVHENAPIIAATAMVIGALFVGITIGMISTRADVIVEKQQIISSYTEALAAKDDLIEILSLSNATVADAVAAQADSVSAVVGDSKLVADASLEKARQAAEDARKAAAQVEAARKKQAQDARKLKGLR